MPHLAPDFAYLHSSEFYEPAFFKKAYEKSFLATSGFTNVAADQLERAIKADPAILLPLRVITGLTKGEFAASTTLVSVSFGLKGISAGKVDSMERRGTSITASQAHVIALTLDQIMSGALFGEPPGNLKSKQNKPDTEEGWLSVRDYAVNRVPYSLLLHQRHYGGAFSQVLNATSELRGDLIEDSVESVFIENRIPYIRTGSHNQGEIAARFDVTVLPAPDFVVYDSSDTVRGMLECKLTNDGGTARDKALRFKTLRDESKRLGGLPLFAVLGGLGWTRTRDTLGPVIRDCDGRVFSVVNVTEMLTVFPFPTLAGLATVDH